MLVQQSIHEVTPDGRFRSSNLPLDFLSALAPRNLLRHFSIALLEMALAVCRNGNWTYAGELRFRIYVNVLFCLSNWVCD